MSIPGGPLFDQKPRAWPNLHNAICTRAGPCQAGLGSNSTAGIVHGQSTQYADEGPHAVWAVHRQVSGGMG